MTSNTPKNYKSLVFWSTNHPASENSCYQATSFLECSMSLPRRVYVDHMRTFNALFHERPHGKRWREV